MKATKPQFLPRRRWSSSRGHITFTLAIGPKRTNSLRRICTQSQMLSSCVPAGICPPETVSSGVYDSSFSPMRFGVRTPDGLFGTHLPLSSPHAAGQAGFTAKSIIAVGAGVLGEGLSLTVWAAPRRQTAPSSLTTVRHAASHGISVRELAHRAYLAHSHASWRGH